MARRDVYHQIRAVKRTSTSILDDGVSVSNMQIEPLTPVANLPHRINITIRNSSGDLADIDAGQNVNYRIYADKALNPIIAGICARRLRGSYTAALPDSVFSAGINYLIVADTVLNKKNIYAVSNYTPLPMQSHNDQTVRWRE